MQDNATCIVPIKIQVGSWYIGATLAQWYLDGPTGLTLDCRTEIVQHHYHH